MKTKEGFELRTICNEEIIIPKGAANINFSKIISLNASAAYLWKKLCGKSFTLKEMAQLLTEEYEVDEATALDDAADLAREWIKAGIVSE